MKWDLTEAFQRILLYVCCGMGNDIMLAGQPKLNLLPLCKMMC